MGLKLITGPTEEPVSVAEIVEHSRLDTVESSTYVAGLIAAAREHVEQLAWRALMTQTWELWLDDWPDEDELRLPYPPLASVLSVKYYDDADQESTLDSNAYYVDTIEEPGRIVLRNGQAWPGTTLRVANGIAVRFEAGWASASDVPAAYKQAVRLLVGYWYENREAAQGGNVPAEIAFSIDALIGLTRAFEF